MMLFNSVMKFLAMSYSKFRKDFRRAAMVSVFLPMALLSTACMGDKPDQAPAEQPVVTATVEAPAIDPFQKHILGPDALEEVTFAEHDDLDKLEKRHPFLSDAVASVREANMDENKTRNVTISTAHYATDNHEILFVFDDNPLFCTASGCSTSIFVKKSGEEDFTRVGSGVMQGSIFVSEHDKKLSIYSCSFDGPVQKTLVGDTLQVQQMVSTPPGKPFTCNM